MNIKIQLVVTIMCLASFSVRAQVSLNNANTVEALIGAYPDMPSAGTLGAVYLQSESAMESVQVFHDKLSQIRDRYKVITDASDEKSRTNITKGVDKKLRNDYGKSLGELQNMSETERENWGMGLADDELKKLGINKSARQISAQGGMSEAEQQQLANQMARSMSGMSMSELQSLATKMENMSEEEQMAYMQQSGMANRIRRNASNMSQSSNSSVRQSMSMKNIQDEIISIQNQWNSIDDIYEKEKKEVIEKMRQIIIKYDAQMPTETGKIRDKYYGTVLLTYHTKEEQAQIDRITLQCFTECFTLWRNFIAKRQGVLKTRLTDCVRLDELQAQQLELQGLGYQVVVPSSYSVAEEYWNVTGSVTELPDGTLPEPEN